MADARGPRGLGIQGAVNAALKIRRKQAADARALGKVRDCVYYSESDQDRGLAAVEYREWVLSLLRRLPPAQQEAAAFCLVDGFTPAEAAELLGTTATAMRARLYAARESLRHYLTEENAAETSAGPEISASRIHAAPAGREEVR
jgi:DNA-directed RNA polymerase specialized sigma24 family protein